MESFWTSLVDGAELRPRQGAGRRGQGHKRAHNILLRLSGTAARRNQDTPSNRDVPTATSGHARPHSRSTLDSLRVAVGQRRTGHCPPEAASGPPAHLGTDASHAPMGGASPDGASEAREASARPPSTPPPQSCVPAACARHRRPPSRPNDDCIGRCSLHVDAAASRRLQHLR
jgi:hypothetical protein